MQSLATYARLIAFLAVAVSLPGAAQAAALDGATLSWPWELPFVGILLTIAFAPLVIRRLWHHHYGKFAFAWARKSPGGPANFPSTVMPSWPEM